MSYEVRIDGEWYSTDDLTIAELEAIEKATGTPWSIINPFRSLPECRAIAGAFLVRLGRADDEAIKWFDSQTAKELIESVRSGVDDLPNEFEDGLPLEETGDPSTDGSPGHS